MTYEKFKEKFKKSNSFDIYWSYFISIFLLGIGLFFLYLLNFTDWYELSKVTTKNIAPIWSIYFFCGLLILIGLYGFWRIPKTFGITIIKSDFSIDEKKQIVNQIINDFDLNEVEREEQYLHLIYYGRYSSSFVIYLFYDSNNFYMNVHHAIIMNNGGFTDFGASKRVANKIKSKILANN